MQRLAFFSNQKLVIKGNNSCQKQCFMDIALLNVWSYIQKLSYVFYCNLIYKLKFIKKKCDIFLIFSHNSCMNNHNIQFFLFFFQNKVSEQFSSHCK